MKARALMTDEALTAEASGYESFPAIFGGDRVFFSSSPPFGCDQALVVGGVSGTEDIVEGVGFQALLRAVLTDGSPWVTGIEREKYMGNRSQANEDLQEREDPCSS